MTQDKTDPLLDEHRFFDPNPVVREIAYSLYQEVKHLPLYCPHGQPATSHPLSSSLGLQPDFKGKLRL